MVELLVALAIGLLVSVVALGSLAQSRWTASTLSESTRLHEDGTMALRIIEQQVRQAGSQGLREIPGSGGRVEFHSGPTSGGAWPEPRVIDGTQGTGSRADTLRIGATSDSDIDARDCLGNAPVGERLTSAFELVGSNLRCQGSGQVNAAPLVEGVEDFQVDYAVRSGDGLQYQASPADWSLVQGVRVCLRMASVAGTSRAPVSNAITGCRGEAVASDGRLRRVFVRVIHIRTARA